MKRQHALSLVALLFVTACTGIKVREEALWPFMVSAWPAVHEDIKLAGEPSPAVASAINQIVGAVRANDYALIRGVDWFIVEQSARRGIQVRVEGGMSEGVAASFRERLKNFSEAIQELIR